MQTKLRCLFVVLTMLLPLAARANFTYVTNSDNATITITGYSGALPANLIIPGTTNGYPVTSIGDDAFQYQFSLASVTIPNSVLSIGVSAFDACSNLKSVTLGSGVLSIGDYAFELCSLTNVTMPNSVSSIGVSAFYSCTGLTNVTLGTGVGSIGDSAFESCSSLKSVAMGINVVSIGNNVFAYCSSLTNITVDANNLSYSSANGVLFDKAQVTLVTFPGGIGGSYTIPNNISSIGNDAFFDCAGLTNVTIPNGVTNIGDYAFHDCSTLTSATIPDSVVSIGDDVFDFCTSLTNVTIGSGVSSIGDYEFYGCSALTSVTIPNGITNIGDYAFYGCSWLTNITCLGDAPALGGGSVFSGVHSGATVYYYSNRSSGWSSTYGGLPTVEVLLNPPALGISAYGGNPAVFFPAAAGGNFVLQMSTNLASGNWVTVSNGVVISGVIVTNPPPNAFFRLQ